MINPIELIQEYKEQDYSCEEAVQLAKEDLKEKKACNLKSNQKAELNRINNWTPKFNERSVVYGPKKGVM